MFGYESGYLRIKDKAFQLVGGQPCGKGEKQLGIESFDGAVYGNTAVA